MHSLIFVSATPEVSDHSGTCSVPRIPTVDSPILTHKTLGTHLPEYEHINEQHAGRR